MPKKRHRTLSSVADPATAEAGLAAADAPEPEPYPAGDPSAPALSAPGEEAVVRRTADGWRVGDDELPDLTCAMVLAERHRIRPRQAFEQLRAAARNRGRKVIDIATDVVASATNPLLQLPEELSRQRSGPRHARNPRRALHSE